VAYAPDTIRMKLGPHIRLLLEITCVSVAVVGLVGWCSRSGGRRAFEAIPWVLTLGALVPTLARGRPLRELGFRFGPAKRGALWFGLSGLCMLVLGAIGIGVLECLSIKPPLCDTAPGGQWPLWLFFQFAWVAWPEEIFFRGYFLTNCLKLLRGAVQSSSPVVELAGVCLSAGVFAVAHGLVLDNAAALLTFFPGLILGWLFVRSGSLFPATFLHGAANVGYVLVLGGAT
jgi:membrane protease YdiL (CAAX protease family)